LTRYLVLWYCFSIEPTGRAAMQGSPAPPMRPGDLVQTVSRVKLVQSRSTEHPLLEAGHWLEVLSIGEGPWRGSLGVKVLPGLVSGSGQPCEGRVRIKKQTYGAEGEALVVKRGKVARDTSMDSIRSGDIVETNSVIIMREAEAPESQRVARLAVGVVLEVLEKGEGRRIKVKSETHGEGWISTRARSGKDLIVKRGMVGVSSERASDLWARVVQWYPQLEHASDKRDAFMQMTLDWTLEEAESGFEELHRELGTKAWIGERCAICLEDMQHGDAVCALPHCGHVFHRACLQPWRAARADCPLCRTGCDHMAPTMP